MSQSLITAVIVILVAVLVLGMVLQGFVQLSARGLLHKIHYATHDDPLRDFTAKAGMGKPRDRAKGIRLLARGDVHSEALAELPDTLRAQLARLRLAERVAWTAYGVLACLWVGGLILTG